MIEILISVCADAIIAAAGPVAKAIKARGSSQSARQYADMRKLLIEIPSAPNTLSISADFAEANISPQQQSMLKQFMQSPHGHQFVRTCIIHGALPDIDANRDGIASNGSALMTLWHRARLPFFESASSILTDHLVAIARDQYNSLRTGQSDLAHLLVETLHSQRLQENSKKHEWSSLRPQAILDLALSLPQDVEEQIQRYALTVSDHYGKLTVPTLRGKIDLPVDDLHIQRDLVSDSDSDTYTTLLDAMSEHDRVLLLGDPGGGKSTEARVSAYRLAERVKTGRLDAIPFILELRYYAREIRTNRNKPIIEFITEHVNAAHSCDLHTDTIRYLLQTGQAVVFLDGLDEVISIPERRLIVDRLWSFSLIYPQNCYVFISRTVGYEAAPVGHRYHELLLGGFDTPQVESFTKKFFQSVRRAGVLSDVERFMRQSDQISDIRSNPLLLGVLCNLFSEGRTLPTNTLELYSTCADMLFREWDATREIVASVHDEETTELAIRSLALEVFGLGDEDFPFAWIAEHLETFYMESVPGGRRIDAEGFSRQALEAWTGRRWILMLAGETDSEPYYRFTHRTFLEYFAAMQLWYSADNGESLGNTILPYILSQTGEVVCLLALEKTTKTNAHRAREFLRWGNEEVRQYIAVGRSHDAHILLGFLLRAQHLTRSAGLEDRLETTRNSVRLISRLVPDSAFPKSESDRDDVFDMFRGRQFVRPDNDSPHQLSEDRFALEGEVLAHDDWIIQGVEELFEPLLYLSVLSEAERDEHVKAIEEAILQEGDESPIRAIRVAAVIPHLLRTQLWLDSPARLAVEEMAGRLVARLGHMVQEDADALGYWTRNHLISAGVELPIEVYRGFTWSDLGAPMTYLSTVEDGSFLHYLMLQSLGVRGVGTNPYYPLPQGFLVRAIELLRQDWPRSMRIHPFQTAAQSFELIDRPLREDSEFLGFACAIEMRVRASDFLILIRERLAGREGESEIAEALFMILYPVAIDASGRDLRPLASIELSLGDRELLLERLGLA
jgi:hypothetical protein